MTLLGHLGVQDRPHVSTTVVSTPLAAGLCVRGSLTFRFRDGESNQGCRRRPPRLSRIPRTDGFTDHDRSVRSSSSGLRRYRYPSVGTSVHPTHIPHGSV